MSIIRRMTGSILVLLGLTGGYTFYSIFRGSATSPSLSFELGLGVICTTIVQVLGGILLMCDVPKSRAVLNES